MDDPVTWGVIWLVMAALFGVGEMAAAGSFFLLPFGIGALAASIVSFFGAPILFGWLLFVFGSVAAFAALKPLARKLDEDLPNPTGFGANRLLGGKGVVAADIPAGSNGTGMIKIGGEKWRATGRDGMGLGSGVAVRIVAVEGTRVIVEPADQTGLDGLR